MLAKYLLRRFHIKMNPVLWVTVANPGFPVGGVDPLGGIDL